MSDVAWFVDRYAAEIPARIHSRETAENGNPEWHKSFESYVTDGDGRWATSGRTDQDFCQHPTLANGDGPCPTCDNTGLREVHRVTFRHPMKRTLHELARLPVPKGRPPLDVVLRALAEHDGDVGFTIAALATTWAFMYQPLKARRWVAHALWECRKTYREDAPAREIRGISESQSIAEVAA